MVKMAQFNKDELLKLSPRDRLAKLRELEKEMNQEKEETESLLQDTLVQLQNLEVIENIEAPQPEPMDISKLFAPEEGLEASVSQVSGEENNGVSMYMVSTYEGGNLAHHVQERIDDEKIEDTLYNARHASESKNVSESTDASKNVVESIKKYSRG